MGINVEIKLMKSDVTKEMKMLPAIRNEPGFYLCSCKDGYRVSERDSHLCVDIDECIQWNLCPQSCKNLKGSYDCECAQGYTKTANNECVADGYSYLMIADEEDVKTYSPSADRERELVSKQLKVRALDYGVTDGNQSVMIWTDTASLTDSNGVVVEKPKLIRTILPFADDSSNNYGRAQNLNVDGLKNPAGLSIDWVAQNVYWTDMDLGTINVARIDGSYMKTLITNRDSPLAIAVNPKHGFMYWTEVGNTPAIYRAHMDGNDIRPVGVAVDYPSGLAIDFFHEDRVYVCDQKGDFIKSFHHFDWVEKYVVRGGIGSPTGLDVFENSVYWTSADDNMVYRIDKFGRGVKTKVQNGFQQPTNVKAYSPGRYDTTVPQRCKPDACSHLCLLRPDSYSCACPDGVQFYPGSVNQCNGAVSAPLEPLAVCQCQNGATCV